MMGLLGVGVRYGVPLPCSRLQASEADMLWLDLMAKAGFDPRESINLWMNMEQASGAEPVEFVSTHPSRAIRLHDLEKRLPLALESSRQTMARGKKPQCDRLRTSGDPYQSKADFGQTGGLRDPDVVSGEIPG
jgi:predicted Zn-dependent protease